MSTVTGSKKESSEAFPASSNEDPVSMLMAVLKRNQPPTATGEVDVTIKNLLTTNNTQLEKLSTAIDGLSQKVNRQPATTSNGLDPVSQKYENYKENPGVVGGLLNTFFNNAYNNYWDKRRDQELGITSLNSASTLSTTAKRKSDEQVKAEEDRLEERTTGVSKTLVRVELAKINESVLDDVEELLDRSLKKSLLVLAKNICSCNEDNDEKIINKKLNWNTQGSGITNSTGLGIINSIGLGIAAAIGAGLTLVAGTAGAATGQPKVETETKELPEAPDQPEVPVPASPKVPVKPLIQKEQLPLEWQPVKKTWERELTEKEKNEINSVNWGDKKSNLRGATEREKKLAESDKIKEEKLVTDPMTGQQVTRQEALINSAAVMSVFLATFGGVGKGVATKSSEAAAAATRTFNTEKLFKEVYDLKGAFKPTVQSEVENMFNLRNLRVAVQKSEDLVTPDEMAAVERALVKFGGNTARTGRIGAAAAATSPLVNAATPPKPQETINDFSVFTKEDLERMGIKTNTEVDWAYPSSSIKPALTGPASNAATPPPAEKDTVKMFEDFMRTFMDQMKEMNNTIKRNESSKTGPGLLNNNISSKGGTTNNVNIHQYTGEEINSSRNKTDMMLTRLRQLA
jgi:hypothetical protein